MKIFLCLLLFRHAFGALCSSYSHTQVLDASVGVNVSWTIHPDIAELDLCVAAPMAPGGWLGIGWNTRKAETIRTPGFLMEGSDLILGYFLPNGSACVRVTSMGKPPWEGHLQPHWWGPNGPPCVSIAKPRFAEENGITSLSFTRPLATSGSKENCLLNNNSIETALPQRQLYAAATSTQVPKDCTTELAPVSLNAFAHKHNLFHGSNMVTYTDPSLFLV